MKPELTACILALCMFALTVASIAQVIIIDLKHSRRGKAKRANLIIWMVLGGVVFNIPFVAQAIRGLN